MRPSQGQNNLVPHYHINKGVIYLMKRFFALLGVILLVGLYVSTLVLALINSPAAKEWLKVSVLATLIVPILLYAYLLIYKITKK